MADAPVKLHMAPWSLRMLYKCWLLLISISIPQQVCLQGWAGWGCQRSNQPVGVKEHALKTEKKRKEEKKKKKHAL